MAETSTSQEAWVEHHRVSEELASEAQLSALNGDTQTAERLYREAAMAELKALSHLARGVSRTRGILAVSAVACLAKGGDLKQARTVVKQLIDSNELPEFASVQLRAFNIDNV